MFKVEEDVALDACVAKYEDDLSEFMLVSMLSKSHSDEWITNSGCTYHMCSNNEWFFNFERLNGGVANMGNNNTL